MKFSAKKITEKGQGVWIVTIDGEEWINAVKKGKNKAASNIEIPGFRKGKAPKDKIEKYLTPVKYLNAAVQSVIEQAWQFAREQKSDIEPFNSPVPTPTKINEKSCELQFIFDLKPEIKIGDYKGLKNKDLVKEEIKATSEEINKAIDQYRNRFVMEKEKPNGSKIEKGDVVILDFEGFIDGVAFKGGKELDFKLVIGSGQMIPGFEDSMIGKKVGETFIQATFPEDYIKELSGKTAEFKLNIKEIKERILPNKDDELVKDLNLPGIKTFKELEKSVKTQIIDQKSIQLKNEFVNKVIDLIREKSVIEIPQSAINKEIENLYKEFEAKVQSQKITMKEYKKQTGMTDEAIRLELFDDAKKRIESYLITDKVRNTEKFEVSKEELEEKYLKLAKSFGVEPDYIRNSLLPEANIKEEIIREKIIDFLYVNNG
ncbi:trigger factor [Spiroplasma taiwanense]|uniref:Trigger factor n=1 Tax=Spiroplasma taiwanense CT-1 TaxID=1276220 RepID=S5LZ80_9MOLU|nr:trigger factor [Spiroplasma taiwanense]AGR41012.1 trigger factor [Spiroplasma taiwanense CT-1]